MYQTMKTFLLLVAVIQLAHPTFAQEDEQDSELLAAETARRKAFFEEFCRFSLDLSNQKTNEICQLEKTALRSEAEELRRNIKELKQSQNFTENAEIQCREKITDQLNNINEVQKHNLELSQQNTNLTQATHVTREENLALKFKLKEMNKSITQKSNEVFELLQKNLELGDQNKNVTEMSEKIKNDAVALGMELRKNELQNQNLTEIIVQLQQHNAKLTQAVQITREEKIALSLKIKQMDQTITRKTNENVELQQTPFQRFDRKIQTLFFPLLSRSRRIVDSSRFTAHHFLSAA